MESKDVSKIWEKMKELIEQEVPEMDYQTHFRWLEYKCVDLKNKTIYLEAYSADTKDYIDRNYTNYLSKKAAQIMEELYQVKLQECEDFEKAEEKLFECIRTTQAEMNNMISDAEEYFDRFSKKYSLKPEYDFNNFTVSVHNQYAYMIAQEVIESPGREYNPVFLYGVSGAGKTHLLHAIGNDIKKKQPLAHVVYITAEKLAIEYLDALEKNNIREITNEYEGLDVLIVDGIQSLEGKNDVQKWFLNVFDKLYEAKKQIFIASDRHPSKLKDFEAALHSRLQWHIVADIHPAQI